MVIEIEKIFQPETNFFTVFVVEQRFAVGVGREYFNSYSNKPNFFDSDEKIKKLFGTIMGRIEKSVAPVSKLVSMLRPALSLSSISEVVIAFCKLFMVAEHQAAGPHIINPIIIQEGEITNKNLNKLIHLHKDSVLRPSIIIILKDNDFERAKTLLCECPNGIYAKMIRNSGEEIIYKVLNCGAEDVESFMHSFSEQCYSTCSKTKRGILTSSEWSNNQAISKFAPLLLKYRSSLLFDRKEEVRKDLSGTIKDIISLEASCESDKTILRNMECAAKLFRVFCNDFGGSDIIDAVRISKELGNEVLLAKAYSCADLIPNCSLQEKTDLYRNGYDIFKKYSMEDHAIYCKNNMLIEQFYTDYVFAEEFKDLQVEAVNNVPGMVGLSHIYNNVGIAFLYCGQATEAIDFFNRGLEYTSFQNRIVQKMALESNKMIAESYSLCSIEERRIRFALRQLFDGMGTKRLPFLGADYALNILSATYRQNPKLGYDLVNAHPFKELINESFRNNLLCASERILQMQYLTSRYPDFFPLLELCNVPKIPDTARGKRKEFILTYGFNPFDFSTWM